MSVCALCSEGRQRSLSSVDGQSFEVGGCDATPAAAGGDVSGCLPPPPVQYWRPMCVALKYDAYSLSHDYAATTTTTAAGATDVTALDDDVPATTPVSLLSTTDRRNCFRAANLPPPAAARLCAMRPQLAMTSSTHARCDEHLYEPTNHDTAPSSRDHRTFNDFAD